MDRRLLVFRGHRPTNRKGTNKQASAVIPGKKKLNKTKNKLSLLALKLGGQKWPPWRVSGKSAPDALEGYEFGFPTLLSVDRLRHFPQLIPEQRAPAGYLNAEQFGDQLTVTVMLPGRKPPWLWLISLRGKSCVSWGLASDQGGAFHIMTFSNLELEASKRSAIKWIVVRKPINDNPRLKVN